MRFFESIWKIRTTSVQLLGKGSYKMPGVHSEYFFIYLFHAKAFGGIGNHETPFLFRFAIDVKISKIFFSVAIVICCLFCFTFISLNLINLTHFFIFLIHILMPFLCFRLIKQSVVKWNFFLNFLCEIEYWLCIRILRIL